LAIVGCFCAIGRGPMTISLGPQKDILSPRPGVILQIVQTRQRIASRAAPITMLGLSIANLRRLIAILRRFSPFGGRLVAHRRHEVPVSRGPLARPSAPVVRERVATGREIIVGSVLIFIRAPLIAVARRLVMVRPCLILIGRRLILIVRRLIPLASGALGQRARPRLGRQSGPAGSTDGTRRLLAAGWTRHDLGHLACSLLRAHARADAATVAQCSLTRRLLTMAVTRG
jgi:hypothetical protein